MSLLNEVYRKKYTPTGDTLPSEVRNKYTRDLLNEEHRKKYTPKSVSQCGHCGVPKSQFTFVCTKCGAVFGVILKKRKKRRIRKRQAWVEWAPSTS